MSTLILDNLLEEDKEILFKWINNKELVEHNSFFNPPTWKNHCAWFESIKIRKDVKIFAIRNNAQIIGSCQLLNINELIQSAELQIRIGYFTEMGKGLGSQAVKLLIQYGFETLNLQRIYLHVFSDNIRAYKSYLKTGFKEEGCLRNAALVGDKFKDVKIMAILKEEYFK